MTTQERTTYLAAVAAELARANARDRYIERAAWRLAEWLIATALTTAAAALILPVIGVCT